MAYKSHKKHERYIRLSTNQIFEVYQKKLLTKINLTFAYGNNISIVQIVLLNLSFICYFLVFFSNIMIKSQEIICLHMHKQQDFLSLNTSGCMYSHPCTEQQNTLLFSSLQRVVYFHFIYRCQDKTNRKIGKHAHMASTRCHTRLG